MGPMFKDILYYLICIECMGWGFVHHPQRLSPAKELVQYNKWAAGVAVSLKPIQLPQSKCIGPQVKAVNK